MASKTLLLLALIPFLLLQKSCVATDRGLALTKSLLFFEAQRSGKLPPNQRVTWRGDSALNDGKDNGVDLSGGYFDAGDNVKFGFPFAYSLTAIAWGVVEFSSRLQAKKELGNALAAIRWGTDYLIHAHPQPDVLYVEVGDGSSDHDCWQRPEDMSTPRPSYKIDSSHPGSDVAAESAAALAAASIAFKASDPKYSGTLLTHAKQLLDFARNHRGLYQNSVPQAGQFYSSSGDDDEIVWAAAWLHRATGEQTYLDILSSGNNGGVRSMFSWDDKYVGAQLLVAKLLLEGKVANSGPWAAYKNNVDMFVCSVVQKGNSNVQKSPGGILWFLPWANLQYVTSSMLVVSAYADYLSAAKATLSCPGGSVSPQDLISFANSQVDYILGANPRAMSYMVGFGTKYPVQVHHRGASIVSIKADHKSVGCKEGFDWFNRNSPNPNVLDGALVGGPDANDAYTDSRSNYQQAEPTIAANAALVGVLARLA
ncbi:hypothetical protein OPV22_020486 [Ensete ventricosum]|uniref:Endoglucanase n=1 Tax=Ensete ventricosum TaxID=4639 RepID=A0AAV8QJJ6_ENSVE|nr:hypothetical protein OPV22_020486 [Ensete ventricosum]